MGEVQDVLCIPKLYANSIAFRGLKNIWQSAVEPFCRASIHMQKYMQTDIANHALWCVGCIMDELGWLEELKVVFDDLLSFQS